MNETSTKDYIKKKGYESFINIVTSIKKPDNNDRFQSHGYINPEQFILAGDLLTSKCKTWTWEKGSEDKNFNFLPKEKQFLMTRRVPCLQRVSIIEDDNSIDVIEDNDWTITSGKNNKCEESDNIPDIDCDLNMGIDTNNERTILDDYNDYDDYDDCGILDDDNALIRSSNLIRNRTYDLYITYDQYHQTPKMYIQGYDENDIPLIPEKIYEDISSDYLHKTVSIELHPHLPIHTVFIHPCRHAEVMKKIINSTNCKEIRADQCLFLFLKFISSIIPTINYDYTGIFES